MKNLKNMIDLRNVKDLKNVIYLKNVKDLKYDMVVLQRRRVVFMNVSV